MHGKKRFHFTRLEFFCRCDCFHSSLLIIHEGMDESYQRHARTSLQSFAALSTHSLNDPVLFPDRGQKQKWHSQPSMVSVICTCPSSTASFSPRREAPRPAEIRARAFARDRSVSSLMSSSGSRLWISFLQSSQAPSFFR